MPEAKNNFVGGRMNKDLDERLLRNGEYRDARNIAVSNSETGNSGSVENVAGNVEVTDFDLTDTNLEIIGVAKDAANNRAFFFLTNYTDSSPTQDVNFAYSASKHYIFMYDFGNGGYTKLVEGNFLNFSKTHPIYFASVLENYLYWTDNRNQPRKINITTAIANSDNISSNPYYSKEEHISVAKYYPWNPIRLYQFTGGLNTYGSDYTVIADRLDWDSITPSTGTYTYAIPDAVTSGRLSSTSGSGTGATIDVVVDSGNNIESISATVSGSGFEVGDTITLFDPNTDTEEIVLTLTEESLEVTPTMQDTNSELLPSNTTGTADSTITTSSSGDIDCSDDLTLFVGCLIKVVNSSGVTQISLDDNVVLLTVGSPTGTVYPVTFGDGDGNSVNVSIDTTDTITIGLNPYYDATSDADLEDKFVRFAYRFKYDDNEYSLISPFTQSVFIPKQDGYFLGDSSTIDSDEQKALKSSTVSFFENKVSKATLVIDLPEGVSTAGDLFDELKVTEVEIIYKDSSEPSLKVVDKITADDLAGSTATEITYEYKSLEPTKVLPERELTRVFDKVPVRAKTQEIIGNRVVYGNYQPELPYEDDLDFVVSSGVKDFQNGKLKAFNKKEYPQHTLKQNRTYQVGIVLCDKFGRQSDVITSENSTIKHNFRDSNLDLISTDDIYLGDALNVVFNQPIPSESSIQGYKGLYNSTDNPLGWYSYKVVVKQPEQSYQTVYLPSILNGYPDNSASANQDLAFITLIGDNINKIPRSLDDAIDGDNIYSSDTTVYPRVSGTAYSSSQHSGEQQDALGGKSRVSAIGIRDNLGLGVDEDGDPYNDSPFIGMPEVNTTGSSNPFIAKLNTPQRIGYLGGNQSGVGSHIRYDALRLDVLETKPFRSNIDIYYETSTAGLISELNTEIENNANFEGVPYQVDEFIFTMSEATPINDIVTNEFTIQDVNGTDILNANTTASIVSIKDQIGNFWTNYFDVEKTVGNKFRIKWIGGATPLYMQNANIFLNFDFTIKFTNLVNGQTVSRNLYFPRNQIRNELPFIDENATDFGTKDNALTRVTGGAGVIRLLTAWREVGELTFKTGSIYRPEIPFSAGILYDIESIEYYSNVTGGYVDYAANLFQIYKNFIDGSGVTRIESLVRLLRTGNNTAKLYYSPLVQAVNINSSNIWSMSIPISFGDFSIGNDDFATFSNSNQNDATDGIIEPQSSIVAYCPVFRFASGQVATDFRVTFNVYDANGQGLTQTQYVDFTLNADIYK